MASPASLSGRYFVIGSCNGSCVGPVGILKPCGWQLQPAAVAAAMCGIFTLDCGFSFLKFDFSLIEESCEFTAAAASVAALVSWQHGLFFAAAASVGHLAFVDCYQFLVDILGSRFASVQVEATPRVDVDETPRCISPDLGVDITSLKTSSFILKDQVPFQVFVSVPGRSTAVVWVSGIVSLKEVALGSGLAEWVEEGLIYAMVGSRAHDLRVHVQHTELVSNSTLQFCIRAKGGAGNRIRYLDEWTCGRCRLGGCWSTKTTCFRCGARRDLLDGIPNPQVIPPRERSFPGRPAQAPRPSAPPSTHSPLRKQPAQTPNVAAGLDNSVLLQIMEQLGLSEAVMKGSVCNLNPCRLKCRLRWLLNWRKKNGKRPPI